MSTLADSFIKGSNYIRQGEEDRLRHKQIEKQNARVVEQDALAAQRHDATLESIALRNQAGKAELDEFNENKDNRATLNKLNVENAQSAQQEYKQNSERRKVLQGREDEGHARSLTLQDREDKQYSAQQDRQQKAENRQWLQEHMQAEMYNAMQGKGISPEFYQRMKGTAFDVTKVLDQEHVAALDFMAVALNPEDGRTTPKDPRMLAAFNKVFADELNAGAVGSVNPETGAKAQTKQVISVHPVEGKPGEFYANLKVTYEDGTSREAPMTEGRTGDEKDDTLKTIKVDELVEQVSVRQAYAKQWQQPELVKAITDFEQYKARSNSKTKPDYKGKSTWKGQAIQTEELQTRFEKNHKDFRFVYDKSDNPVELYNFEQYAWTEGDLQKEKALKQVAEQNKKLIAAGRTQDQLLDVRDVWAAENGNKPGAGGNDDPEAARLAKLLDENKRNDDEGHGATLATATEQTKTNPKLDPSVPPESGPDVLYETVKSGRPGNYIESPWAVPKYKTVGTGNAAAKEAVINPDYVKLYKQLSGT